MNDDISPAPSRRPRITVVFHRGRSAVVAVVGVFIISGAFLMTSGLDRTSEGSGGAEGVNADTTVANLSADQYASNSDPGQALVSGTSTLHDWIVKSVVIKGTTEFSGLWKAGSAPPTLQSIDLVIPVDSLKSTEGSGMDNTMYDALKLKQFPTITYKLTKASLKSSPPKEGSACHFDTTGQLTVAGATHPVSLDLGVLPQDGKLLAITTEIKLKMSDFGVKPPTAMAGFIKSGDAITLKVKWQLSTKASPTKAEK